MLRECIFFSLDLIKGIKHPSKAEANWISFLPIFIFIIRLFYKI